jgi:hypothetical protein
MFLSVHRLFHLTIKTYANFVPEEKSCRRCVFPVFFWKFAGWRRRIVSGLQQEGGAYASVLPQKADTAASGDGCCGTLTVEVPGRRQKIRRKAGKAAIFFAGKLNVKMEQKLHI